MQYMLQSEGLGAGGFGPLCGLVVEALYDLISSVRLMEGGRLWIGGGSVCVM